MAKISTHRKHQIYIEAEELAKKARIDYKILNGPVKDIFVFLESIGILVVRFPCNDLDFSGFITKMGQSSCVYINSLRIQITHSKMKGNYIRLLMLKKWEYLCYQVMIVRQKKY